MSINEELSFTEYTLTEDTTDFIISFDRIGGSTDEVSILVNNTPIEDLVGYTVLQVNFSTWQVDPALPAGTVVRLARTTNLDKMVYVFTAGSKFIAKNVDDNFKQIQHSQQEVRDRQDKLEGDTTALLIEVNDVKIIAEQAAEDANEALIKVDEILNTGVVPASMILTSDGGTQQQFNDTQEVTNLYGAKDYAMPAGGYPVGGLVRLENGDIVESTIPNNTNDPNINPIGWYSPKQSQAAFVSIFDYMTMAQFRDWKANPDTYNVTSVLQAAINAPDVYEVFLPQGTYLHSGLYCDKNNFRFYSNSYARSILKSDNTAHVALHVAKNVVSISGFFLDGVKLQGNANTLRGIQLGDSTKAVQFCNLNNCMIDGFTKSDACDIYLGSVQELDIVNTMSWRGNIGIYRPTGGYGTSIKISGKAGYLGRHAKHGIRLDGQIDDIYVQDNVIEGNGLEAIYISDTAFKNTQGVTIYLQNAYFEANGQTGAGAGVVYAKGSSAAYKLHRIYTSSCNFADNPNAPSGFKNIAGGYVALSVSGSSNMLPSSIGVTNSYISYQANLTVSAGDITQQLKDLAALTGNKLMASGFDYIRSQATSPSKNVQTNFFSSITFPTTAVLSSDTTTLDDYREVSDFVPVVTGHGGTVSAATCRYTKIGNLVNFAIQLTTQNFTSTVGTTKVSLPHPQLIATTSQFMNNQNYAGGFALVASQAVNLPTLPSQGSVAAIYITGQYMTAQ